MRKNAVKVGIGTLVVGAAFASNAAFASAQVASEPTVKDCHENGLLLTVKCTVSHKCPDRANVRRCITNGAVEVIADKPFGMVKGDVWVTFPPGPAPRGAVMAECGAPRETVRRCTTQTPFMLVPPGRTIRVECNANRHFPTIGLLSTDVFCQGRFAVIRKRR